MRTTIVKAVLLICAVVLLGGGATLSATTLYEQSWDLTANLYASQNDSNGFGNFATVFDDFSLISTNTITHVNWIGGYFNPPAAGTITHYDVGFWSDAGGVPGALLYNESVAGDANETFITNATGFPTYSYNLALTSPFLALAGTTYWLSVVPTLGFPPQWGWAEGTGGDGISYQIFHGSGGILEADMAFSLDHIASGVPEPVSMVLAGAGLILLGFAARRRRA